VLAVAAVVVLVVLSSSVILGLGYQYHVPLS